jgi:hypothetical protein
VLCSALLLSAFVVLPVPPTQGQPPQYFPETRRTVRAPFIDYFVRHGGVAQFGYPISDDYVDPTTGLLVQYFDKGRLEWHPGNPEPYKVQLGLLADEMGKRQPPIPTSKIPAANDPNCVHFDATGHTLCMEFREFWNANGGLDRFGYPIGEYTIENGYLVQYFQRARLEWHPARPQGERIQVAPLGQIYLKWRGWDGLPPIADGGSANPGAYTATAIAARASVFNPVAVAKSPQTAFVYVTDQLGRPVGNAGVTLVVQYPAGPKAYTLPPTSASGTSFQTFIVPEADAGAIISMEFVITHAGLFGSTRTSFMVWY